MPHATKYKKFCYEKLYFFHNYLYFKVIKSRATCNQNIKRVRIVCLKLVYRYECTNMTEELSGVTIVIFIAVGVLTILLLFIFGKRQIMRFALRSRRGPHIPIGHDAQKV